MSSHAVRLLLIRHGEAEGNREFRYLGDSDAPLTANGREQARLLGESLRGAPLRAIYASPLLRARDTAAALALGREPALEPQPEDRLREQSYGAWEGLTSAQAQERYPREHAEWERDQRDAPPDGEPLAALRLRSVALACELAQRHSGEVIALVSHVGPIKALICAALGLPTQAARRMWLTPASVCIVDWSALTPADELASCGVLRLFNGGPEVAALAQTRIG